MNNIPVSINSLSIEARLVYLTALLHADALGTCEGIFFKDKEIGLDQESFGKAIIELNTAGLISLHTERIPIAQLGNGNYVMDSRVDCLINDFVSPIRHDRLSAESWAYLRETVFERDNYICQYCGEKGGQLECDHVIPLSRGGTNELGNLVTACPACNRSKRSTLISEWKGRNDGQNQNNKA